MPWDQRSIMDQKRLFIADYLTRSFTIVELCDRYGISRPTAYKWIRRFLNYGYTGLEELPRRMVVVGGGYIGLEMGLVYAGLGSKVTMVEFFPRLLMGADDDLVAHNKPAPASAALWLFDRIDAGRLAPAMGVDFPAAKALTLGLGARVDARHHALAAKLVGDFAHESQERWP